MLQAFLVPLCALPVSLGITLALVRLRPRRALAAPAQDRWHTRPTPALGGIAIFAGVAVGYGALVAAGTLEPSTRLAGFFGGVALVFAAGLADDLRPLPAWAKLAMQLAAVAVVIAAGNTIEIIDNEWIAYPLTALWLVGVTNAFNLLDNMDGLAGLVAVVSAGLFAASGYLQESVVIVGLAVGLAYACLGFLPFNLRKGKPAAIFMGDSGSQLLGLTLGVIALWSNWRGSSNVVVALLVPFLLLAVPILDTALVTFVRLGERRPVHLGGRDHTSHRLVRHGLSERRAVLLLTGLAATLGGVALALRQIDRPFMTIAGVCLSVALLVRFGLYLAGVEQADRAPRAARPLVSFHRLVLYRRQLVEIAIDALIVAGAYSLSYAVRFESYEEDSVWRSGIFWHTLWLVVPAQLVAFWIAGLYRGIWRHAGFRDLLSIVYAVVGANTVLLAILTLTGRFEGQSRGPYVIDTVICAALIAASRLGERWIEEFLTSVRGSAGARRVLIVGAGTSGISLLRELRERPGHTVLGFLDDDQYKQGMRIQRVPILGSCWNVGEAIERVRADLVVVSIPRAPRETLTHIVSSCELRGVACRFALREHDLDPAQFLAGTGASTRS
jgi:UDP-GlcNAc:undecaprenyl-phosphate GlcNAc-1-phosphate transferase